MPKANRIVIFGHIVAVMPIVSYLAMVFYYHQAIYDKELNLIGPRWLLTPAGQAIVVAPWLLTVIGGVICFFAGCFTRRQRVIIEGVWACCASFFLFLMYLAAEW